MSVTLRINGEPLDLSQGAVIALTKQVANIGQFQNRLSSFTNKFELPLTSHNRTLLGIESAESNSPIPYTEQPCSLWFNGIEVASNSRLIIDQWDENVKVTLRPGNSTFFDIIKTLRLRDFDLSDFDHLWNRAFIILNKDNDWTDGICYPVIETGNQSSQNAVVQTQGLIGGMFMKYLINRIATFYGFDVTFPTDTLMDELFISITNQQVGPRISDDVAWKTEKATQTLTQTTSNQVWQLSFDQDIDWPDKWTIYDNQGSFPFIRLPFRGLYRCRISFDITIAATATAEIRINSNILQPLIQTIGTTPSSGTYEFEFEITLETYQQTTLNQISYASVWLELRITDFITTSGATITNLEFECVSNDLPETNYNRPISIQHNLPDMTVGQLFVEFGNLTGSYYDVDDIAGVIKLIRLNDLFDNKNFPYIYQDKIDSRIKPLIRYQIQGYGRTNVLRYANDSDANFAVVCANDQLPDTADLVKSVFNSSNDVTWAIGIVTAIFRIWNFDDQRINMDGEARIVRVIPQSNPISLNFFESNLVNGNASSYNIGTFDGLDWETLYIQRYEKIIGGIIDRMMYVEIFFKIDEYDLISFDFSRPVYLQTPNGYFYVQRISEFTGREESTKFVLIRI